MSVAEFEQEPWEAVYQANLIWSLDSERAKLEEERRRPSKM